MSIQNHPYVIEGSQAGKARLSVLSQTLKPTTKALLEHIGIEPGMDCLHVGSGGADATLPTIGLHKPSGGAE